MTQKARKSDTGTKRVRVRTYVTDTFREQLQINADFLGLSPVPLYRDCSEDCQAARTGALPVNPYLEASSMPTVPALATCCTRPSTRPMTALLSLRCKGCSRRSAPIQEAIKAVIKRAAL